MGTNHYQTQSGWRIMMDNKMDHQEKSRQLGAVFKNTVTHPVLQELMFKR